MSIDGYVTAVSGSSSYQMHQPLVVLRHQTDKAFKDTCTSCQSHSADWITLMI